MSILLLAASAALPLFPLLIFFIYTCNSLIANSIRESITFNPAILISTHLKWAWNFLFHRSLFTLWNRGVPENGSEHGNRISYKRMARSDEGAAVECAVCLCKIEEGEEIGELRCDHLFHRVCLDRWIGCSHGTCPLCRDYLAPRRMVAELGEEVILFKFCSFGSSNRSTWWLR